jgi:hypothetical protein
MGAFAAAGGAGATPEQRIAARSTGERDLWADVDDLIVGTNSSRAADNLVTLGNAILRKQREEREAQEAERMRRLEEERKELQNKVSDLSFQDIANLLMPGYSSSRKHPVKQSGGAAAASSPAAAVYGAPAADDGRGGGGAGNNNNNNNKDRSGSDGGSSSGGSNNGIVAVPGQSSKQQQQSDPRAVGGLGASPLLMQSHQSQQSQGLGESGALNQSMAQHTPEARAARLEALRAKYDPADFDIL